MMHQLGFGFEDGVPVLIPVDTPTRKPARKTAAKVAPAGSAITHAPAAPALLLDAPELGLDAVPPAVRSAVADSPGGDNAMAPMARADAAAASLQSLGASEAVAFEAPGLEALAVRLEAHPDYRVLRRLVPRLHYGAADTAAAADSPAGIARLLILDTETTGLSHARDRIMELALLRVDVHRATGQPVGPVQVYDGLEDPGQPIPAEVRAITGIDDDMVRGQQLDLARIAELLDGVDLIVAHNAGFDRPFVEARLPDFATKAWACSFADIDWKGEGRGSAKLESLALGLGLFYDAHRAEMDCHALLAVLHAELPAARVTGLARLLAAAPTLRYRLQANGAPFDAKDLLKDRGYRWDATQKVWHTRIDDAARLEAETAWMKTQVYGGRPARVQVETLDAMVRYSARAGLLDWHVL